MSVATDILVPLVVGSSQTSILSAPVHIAFRDAGTVSRELFEELASRWKRDTLDLSSLTRIVTHPAYLRIISMGERAIPLILDDLLGGPAHWFAALSAITGRDDVIPMEDAGDIEKMSEAWLEWGKSESYL